MSEEFQSGELLDNKYQIEKLLGQGGMGAVYRALHLGTKRTVAVKVIHPQFSNDEEFVARFRREAEATGRLRHPNVVDVTDFGFAESSLGRVAYLVMEYLDGCTLEEILAEESSLRLDWVVDILEQVCSAVDAAHRLGIVHRDLKPDNIWLEPNRRGGYTVKVLDFGLVKLGATSGTASPDNGTQRSSGSVNTAVTEAATLIQMPAAAISGEEATLIQMPSAVTSASEAATLVQIIQHDPSNENGNAKSQTDASEIETAIIQKAITEGRTTAATAGGKTDLTQVGSVMGTPLYMSPEQCRGDFVDNRSDIYSLGVITYRMLCGVTPFTGKVVDLIKLHSTVAPPPIRERNRKVPKKMAQIVMSALAKNPDERPQTANGFASALKASAEKTSTILRHAISLYAERFPLFIKISLIACAPLIILSLIEYFISRWTQIYQSGSVASIVVIALLIPALAFSQIGGIVVTNAVTVPVVLQTILAPLRPIRLRPAFAALMRRKRVFIFTSLIVMIASILGSILLVLPGIFARMSFALYAPIIIIEGLGVRATLKRSYQLMKRCWTTVLAITVVQVALGALVYRPSFSQQTTVHSGHNVNVSFSTTENLSQLLMVLITPLTAIMLSLLYLKTRQAGGEGIQESVEQFTAQDMPTTKWQSKMSSKLKTQSGSEYRSLS